MCALVVKDKIPRIHYMQVLIIRVLVTNIDNDNPCAGKVFVRADKNGCVDNDMLADNNTFSDDNETHAVQSSTCK